MLDMLFGVASAVLPYSVALMMFGFGLATPPEKFREAFSDPVSMACAIGCPLLFAPLVAYGLATLMGLEGNARLGLMLVAACPAGALTSMWTMLSGGRVALSLLTTFVTTALCGLTVPFYLALIGYEGDLPLGTVILKLISLTGIPLVVGLLAYRFLPQYQALGDKLKSIGSVLILALFGILTAAGWQQIADAWATAAMPVLVFNVVIGLIGFAVSRFWLSADDIRYTIIPVFSTRQEEVGLFVALGIINAPILAAPLLLNALFGSAVALIYVLVLKARARTLRAEKA
jgi:bile acid:Na+ symporter, BASS family